jgi:hypothetical protein
MPGTYDKWCAGACKGYIVSSEFTYVAKVSSRSAVEKFIE